MTTLTFDHTTTAFPRLRAAPTAEVSRPAVLRTEPAQSPTLSAVAAMAAGAVLALLPVSGLAWMFVTL